MGVAAWEQVSSLDSPTRRLSHSINILVMKSLTSLTRSLTAILIYRFILDLQEANEHNVKVGSDDPELQMSQTTRSQSSLCFVDRAIGSLGSTIHRHAAPARDEWDEDSEGAASHSRGEVADGAISLDDLVGQPELHTEIQQVLRSDELLARAV